MTNIPISIRLAVVDDLAFFYSAALQSYFYSSRATHGLLPETFYKEHKRLLAKILQAPKAMMAIACLDDDPRVIVGFILAEPLADILHYVYVKQAFRRFGVAKRLLAHLELSLDVCTVTHWTSDMASIGAKRPGMIYNPYLLAE